MAINSNKRYDISPEMPGVMNSFLDFMFRAESSFNSLLLNKNGDAVVKNRSFMNKNIEINSFKKEISEVIKSHIFVDTEDKDIIGWKENNINPAYESYDTCYRYLKQLNNIFPGIVYIINIRDPRDTAKSAMWSSRKNAYDLIVQNNNFFEDISNNLLKNNSILLNYDIWSTDPQILINNLSKIKVDLNINDVEKIFSNRYNHLKIW